MIMLEIKDLHASINGKEILKGINLTVKPGEVHAIMGPNGSGKSTLSSVLVGNPAFEVTKGSITFYGKNLLELSPEDRSHEGIFLSFQYPVEIPGVSMVNFMRAAVNEQRKYKGLPALTASEFLKLMREKRAVVELDNKLANRSVNEGFSGGEKKRNEIFQMAMLEPRLSILDETDSGLDIDALRIVAEGVNKLKTPETSTIVITHYQRLLDYISQPLKEERVSAIQEIAGHGVQALVDGHPVAVGNAKLMEKIGAALPGERTDGTTVYVAADGKYIGCIVISDVVKPTAKAAMAALKENGVKMTVMLTGDAKAAADRVAAEIGMDRVESELLPGDKVAQVEKLLAEKGPKENLAFVGDGINDAPVLSRADVGIAMGALGSDAAIEAADVVLMDDDPSKIALAMKISRHTLQIVWQNIVFALAVKAVCLVLGALGIAGMWLAIFADVGVMVLAVLNATRALKIK